MARKLRITILTALLIVLLVASQALAAPSIRFTLNGAREGYNAGSVFMLFGRAEDSGMALPDADVFIKVDSGDSPIYWSQTRTDGNGYFQTYFNLPNSGVGSNLRVAVDAPGSNVLKKYPLGKAVAGLSFISIGFNEKASNQLIPADTSEIILVFDSNVNYFNNKSADADLRFLGSNEKNADCARVYEKGTDKRISTSARLVTNDYEGDQQVSFFKPDGTQLSEMRKRLLQISLHEPLTASTTYRVVISGEMAANNSAILGQDQVVEFTTKANPKAEGNIPVAEKSIASAGGTISEPGVTIVIPANAISNEVKVTIEKVLNTSALPVDDKSNLVSEVFEIIKDRTGNFSEPVTITLSFDKSKVDANKYDVKICYFDEQENKWIPLDNVTVDLAAGTVSGDTTHFTKFAVIAVEKAKEEEKPPVPVQVVKLSDIQGHWAEKFITELVASGAIGGYPDGTFKPDQTISRAEFATILVKAFQLPAKNGKVFDDTANHWGREFIATAAAHGIVSGYSDTAFGPDDSITREQMAVMIAKAANLQASSSQPMSFKDEEQISSWAAEAVSASVSKGIINGYPDNTFRPRGSATRAEAVTVIVQTKKLAL